MYRTRAQCFVGGTSISHKACRILNLVAHLHEISYYHNILKSFSRQNPPTLVPRPPRRAQHRLWIAEHVLVLYAALHNDKDHMSQRCINSGMIPLYYPFGSDTHIALSPASVRYQYLCLLYHIIPIEYCPPSSAHLKKKSCPQPTA